MLKPITRRDICQHVAKLRRQGAVNVKVHFIDLSLFALAGKTFGRDLVVCCVYCDSTVKTCLRA